MGTFTLGSQRRALGDAEAVLLVGDDKAQILKLHRLREQRVGADDNLRLSHRNGVGGLAALPGAQ